MGRFIIGITGASGSIYAQRLIFHLKALGHEVHLVCTEMGRKVCAYEKAIDGFKQVDKEWSNQDLFAPIASGSHLHQGMVVIPCSMGTLGKIAQGIGDNLLTRAADVCLKERRRLILVPRETPLSLIHLRNLEKAAEAGAMILPASPSFYQHPVGLDELLDTVLSRVLDQLGVEHQIGERWREPRENESSMDSGNHGPETGLSNHG